MKIRLAAVAGLAFVFVEPAFAQEMKTCDGPQEACQSIVSIGKLYDAAFNKGDVAGLVALYRPDATIVGEGPMISGKDAIEKNFQKMFKTGATNHLANLDQVHVVGDMAWMTGSWSTTGPGPNNTIQPYNGKFGAVEVNNGGTWQIQMLTWNMSHPPPEQAAASASKQ